MKIAIIGRTQILYEVAQTLHKEGHKINCIVTAKAAPEYTRDERDFEKLAQHLGASFFLSNSLNRPEITESLKDLDIGISVNWPTVIEKCHTELFQHGILNSHHGDLPKYRGNACANWAILNNEKKITNSIHFMEGGKLDCGRIICQDHYKLSPESCITDINLWSQETIPKLFTKAIKLLENDPEFTVKYADPNGPESFRCFPRLPQDSFISWDLPVLQIHNLIRASCAPLPGAYTFHWHKDQVQKLFILKSRIVNSSTNDMAMPGQVLENNHKTGESLIRCGDGILAILRGRYEYEADEFSPGNRWKSIRMRLGVRLEDWLWELSKQ